MRPNQCFQITHADLAEKKRGEGSPAPLGPAPADVAIGGGRAVDAWLAVDGQVARRVEGDQLLLDVPRLQLQRVHLAPWQHVHAAVTCSDLRGSIL